MFSGDSPSDNLDREGTEKKDNKKDKDKGYVAFRSDCSDRDSDNDDEEDTVKTKSKKSKKDRPSTLRLRIKSKTKKKKEKEKDKDKEKEKDKNKKKQKKSDVAPPLPPSAPIFGVPLSVAVKRSKPLDEVELPKIARDCILYMEEHGLSQEGIYRISGSKSKIDSLKDLYNRGLEVNLDEFDVYTIGSLLKMFLRELPDNILVQINRFEELVAVKEQSEKIVKFRQLLSELPPCNFALMSWLMVHMSHVVQNPENKMTVQNIIIVLSPTLSIHHHGILYFILNNVNALFPDTKITRCTVPVVSPIAPLAEEDDPVLPSSPESIEVELARREAFLAKLHEDLKANESEDEKETKAEQLWEIQRTVTMLKRKLRKAHRASDVNSVTDEKKEEEEDQETIKQLLATEAELLLEQEELNIVTNKLRQLIETERNEIIRLKEEIQSITERKESTAVFSDTASGSDSDSESDDERELQELINDLMKQNEELEESNNKLCQSLLAERENCVALKVQIKKLQQQQQEQADKSKPGQQQTLEIK